MSRRAVDGGGCLDKDDCKIALKKLFEEGEELKKEVRGADACGVAHEP